MMKKLITIVAIGKICHILVWYSVNL